MEAFIVLVFIFVIFIACCFMFGRMAKIYSGGFEPVDLVSSLRTLMHYRDDVASSQWPIAFKDAVLRKLSKLDFIHVLTHDMENKIRRARVLPAINKIGVDRVLVYYESIATNIKDSLERLKQQVDNYATMYSTNPSATLIAKFNADQNINNIIDKLAGMKYPTDMDEVASAKYGIQHKKAANQPPLYPGNAIQRISPTLPPVEIVLNTGTAEDVDEANHPNHTILWHKIGAVSRGQYPADKVRWVYLKRVGNLAANPDTHRTIASPNIIKLLESNLATELKAPVGKSLNKLQQLIEDNVAPYKDILSASDINNIEQIFASYKA